jgi:TatD DNase family protein
MIDSHSHLYFDDFKEDLDDIIKRAQDEAIEYIINIGTTLETSVESIELASKYPFMFASVGVHPHDAEKVNKDILKTIEELASKDKVVAIGEIGLDYYRNISDKKAQQKVFAEFINIAKNTCLPLVIHNREANEDCLSILNNENYTLGVFHCFSGDKDFAKKVLDKGFYVSFAGPITFPNAEMLRETAKYVPLDRILIETDCPFLAPQEFRGKRNEPVYVKFIAKKLAEIKKIDIEVIDKITTENTKRLFNLPDLEQ